MAALGTNMGKKPEKKSENPVVKKPKKKVVQAKAKTPKKAMAKPQAQKPPKKVVKQPKKVTAKPSVSKKPVATKSAAKPKQSKTTKVQKTTVKAKAVAPKKVKAESAPKKVEQKLSLRKATLTLEPSKRKKIRKTKVILEGDLSINNVDAFMSQIEPIFDDYDYVDFFQREVTALDLCHIQMLYYFQNHPTRKGKTVTVNSELPTDLKKVVTNAGFKEFMFIPKLV